ncbi:leucyl aminopeptidase [Sporanaerobium hydrogeniformans]|uniref:Leucyl aminopeptidase n=1 Tax=Sporanaerobium hydrogeniformans TaxID=3072179 RepID=A0AC61D9U1_9FIRM|nr:leucyl aminopeptidase [Sporanaerobium hydrogeniformans]PHV69990.1 leucyl aminopeptidase [Sporanaerobium hydrogeniformans]
MLHYELQHAADKLIKEMFAVKSGETVIITADTCSNEQVVEAVASSAYAAGAIPMVITIPTPSGVGKAADPNLPIDALAGALVHADVWIEFNHQWLLYSTPFERAEAENKKLRYMCLVDFTPELLIRTVGKVETSQLKIFMQKVTEMTKAAHTMRVTTPAGCDVSFEIDPNHFVACDCGDASYPAIHMLTGQINVVPKFGSIQGTIVFDGCVTPPFGHVPHTPIALKVENSIITQISGGTEATEFERFLKSFDDEGMFKMAHIAYGFNPGAILTGNIVEDERVWGCTEWGIGYVSPFDAPPIGQDAKSHCDGICLNSSVWLDNKLIMKEGKIVDETLLALSPVK